MPDPTKRTLDELITLHELEPDLREVITEGRSDSAILLWFLRRNGIDAAVYSISDRLDVPASEVRRRGQDVGNKGRVIAAALGVEANSGPVAQKVTFVYDVDDDVLAGKQLATADCLLATDYSSMEMYAFAEDVLDKMLKITLRASDDLQPKAVLAAITTPLMSIAFVRLVLKGISPSVAIINAIERRCSFQGDVMGIDVPALISDSVNAAGGARALGVLVPDLLAKQRREMNECNLDVRLVIRGHDFTQICCHYLKSVYPALFRDDRGAYKVPATFEGALMTCLEAGDLAGENLFVGLLRRMQGTEAAA